jgi:hypothetical protein
LVVSFLLSKLRIGCQEQKYTYYWPYLELHRWILEGQNMAETNFFAFSLLFSVPKVGSQDETKLI